MANHTWKVSAEEAGVTLDKFLASPDRLGSRSRAAAARERGKVFVNDAEAGKSEIRLRLKPGDEIRLWEDRPGSAHRRATPFKSGPLRILYEDQYLIVLDKPAGLLAVPLERRGEEVSIFDQIEDHLRSHGKRKPLVVHRIDRDTSGVVLFAKEGRTQAALKQQFRQRTPERVYLAVVYGHPTPQSGTWKDHLVWDRKALIQKETHPDDPRAAEAISQYKWSRRSKRRASSRFVSRPANGIRFASRRACAATHWSAKCATRSAPITCARSRSNARRCTHGV